MGSQNKNFKNYKDSILNSKKLFLIDLDGTVCIGDKVISGTEEFLKKIKEHGSRFVFFTNNSSKSNIKHLKRVQHVGIKCNLDNIYSSTDAAIFLFEKLFKNQLIYAQGTKRFIKQLKKGGLYVTTKYTKKAKAILVGYDTELTYKKQITTCKMLFDNDIPYYATHIDYICPTEFGYVPDCGCLTFCYEKCTNRTPIYIGKPSPLMIELILEKYSIDKKDAVLIGDRIYTDIKSGVAACIDTILVLSGETTLKDYQNSEIKPTYLVDSIKDLL